MKYTSACKKCNKAFTHPTQEKADQALKMHVGRMHKKTITPGNPKRPVKRRKEFQVAVNFCPGCGCNLHAVAVGLAMASK